MSCQTFEGTQNWCSQKFDKEFSMYLDFHISFVYLEHSVLMCSNLCPIVLVQHTFHSIYIPFSTQLARQNHLSTFDLQALQ